MIFNEKRQVSGIRISFSILKRLKRTIVVIGGVEMFKTTLESRPARKKSGYCPV
jgi:hypothetical protein